MSARIQRSLFWLFIGSLCLAFGEVYSAQLLGMLRAFRPAPALLLTLITAGAAFWFYRRWGGRAFAGQVLVETRAPGWVELLLFGLGALVVALVVLYPTAVWPFSTISETLHHDAGAYHFPLAVEMFKSGSAWDLSIPYGEYPYGYESLLGFALLLTRSDLSFGAVHAFIALFAFLGIWLLARRLTVLPGGLLFSLTALVFTSELITIRLNPFYIFLDQAHMIGKNDLFLACGVMAAYLHAPIGPTRERSAGHLPGLAFATLLVLATKPAGMFAVAPLWVPVAWNWLKRRPLPWREVLFACVVVIPGAWWVARNLLIIRTIFPEGVWVMNEWSIVNNLTNPFLYNYLPRNFLFLLAVLGAAVVSAALKKAPGWRAAAALALLLAAFALTPESAFQKTTQEPTKMAWRLGIALVAGEFAVGLALLETWLRPLLARLPFRRIGWTVVAAITLLASAWVVWQGRSLLRYIPSNIIVLQNEFREPPEPTGYSSPYEYVRANLRNAVIYVHTGVFYYLYGPGFTNSPTKLQYPLGRADLVPQLDPEYYFVIGKDDFKPSSEFYTRWTLIYEDSDGLIYRRIR